MKYSNATSAVFTSRLLGVILWEMSLLGHKTLDLVRLLLKPGGWFRSLPHVRILLVLSMLILIFNDNVSYSFTIGDHSQTLASTSQQSNDAVNAGFFNGTADLVGSLFHASAFAKTSLTLMDSETGLAIIDRFQATALLEEEKLGIDAGVLLATAIAAGAVQTEAEVKDTKLVTNFFGPALKGSYPNAWSSWRAMSLSVLASVTAKRPSRDDFVSAAALQFEDTEAATARIYEALRFYQL